jgi:hypothetical protein
MGANSFAQSNQHTSKIEQLFGQPAKSVMISQYRGLMDGTFPVYIALGQLDNELKGYYQFYSHSKLHFLEGLVLEDGELELYELSEFDDVLGFITGKFNDNNVSWLWHNVSNSLAFPISATILPAFHAEEVEKLWFDTIQVFAISDKNLNAKIYWNKTAEDYLLIDFKNTTGLNKNNLKIEKNEANQFELTDGKIGYDISEYSSCQIAKKQWVGDRYLAISEYVRTDNEKFNGWFRQFVDDQLIELIKEINLKFEDDPGFIAEDKYQYLAKLNVQLDFVSDRLISGIIWVSSNARPDVQMTPFIYDLYKSRSLGLGDIFKSDFNYSFYLKQHLKQTVAAKQKEVDFERKSWLRTKAFDTITLDDYGLKYYTNFNTIYGFEFIQVPMEEVEGYIKNKSVKKAFAID